MSNIENNNLQLLEHQEEAYRNVIKLFNEKGKAAVIFPTGCGKSFVTLKYILEHPDDRILFLSPRNAIKDQMYEYVIRYIGGDFRTIEEIQKEYGMENNASTALRMAAKEYIPNIECMLYQTISGYGEKDSVNGILEQLKPDVIIVDEMHHLKTKSIKDAGRNKVVLDDESDEIVEYDEDITSNLSIEEQVEQNKWGEKFHKYLEDNPQAKLLGLSATPLRTDGTNVVERIFEDSVASEISLLEAIEQGIIYSPKYVVPDFIREDELETLLQKIEQAEGGDKEELKEKYNELVKKSANASGIPELMQEHIEEKNGKYIIYCKDVNDMQEKMKKAEEWFGKIDEEPEVYGIHSKDKTSAMQLEQFKTSNSEHLKLMYCVGMIDEGMHLSDISGVILSSKTGSRPTYLQRIGRGISSGKNKKQALVIDLVNNNEILYDSKVQHGYEVNDLELLQELVEWVENNDGELPEFDEEKTTKERTMAKRLARINNKYLKYVDNDELTDYLDDYKRKQIGDIIALGSTIGMFEDTIELDLSEEERKIETFIDTFLDDIEIKGVRREFRDMLMQQIVMSSVNLKNALKIKKWCEVNFGDKKIWERRLPMQGSDNEEERQLANQWNYLKIFIIGKYDGIELQNVDNEEEQQILEILRRIEKEYAFGKQQKHYKLSSIMQIENWCKVNFEDKEKWERRLPIASSDNEEELSMHRQLVSLRGDLLKRYEGIDIEKIEDEDDKKILQKLKEIDNKFAFGYNQLHYNLGTALQIENWCKVNFEDKEKWERRLPKGESDNELEVNLGRKLGSLRNNLLKKYENLELEEIQDEEDRRVVEIIRELDDKYAFGFKQLHYNLGTVLQIENWCKVNFEDKEKWERRLPKGESDNELEANSGRKLSNLRNNLLKKYENLELEEIQDEEDRRVVEIIRELDDKYAFGFQQLHYNLGTALQIENWCKVNFEDKEKWERRLPTTNLNDQEEKNLRIKLVSLKKDVVSKYECVELEDIQDEDDRRVVKIIRKLDEEYAFDKQQLHYNLGSALQIRNWCEVNFGDKEECKRKLPNRNADNEEEKKLGMLLKRLRRDFKKYEDLELEEIQDEEDRRIVEIIRELDEEYNPKIIKQKTLAQAKKERDCAKQKNKEAIELEQQVEAQLNERGKNHEEQ